MVSLRGGPTSPWNAYASLPHIGFTMRRPDSFHKSSVIRRLETGERWWTAEFVIRLAGLILLGLCAAACLRLTRPVPACADTQAKLGQLEEITMNDLIWLAVLGGLFLLTLAYVRLCDEA
jgi:hypothetical protein